MQIRCACKINVYLKILGKRADGYHELSTLFWPMPEPFDILEIEVSGHIQGVQGAQGVQGSENTQDIENKQSAGYAEHTEYVQNTQNTENMQNAERACISVICETKGIDSKNNTLTKAYDLYTKKAGFYPSLQVKLQKGIPHGAGLGGGSSDAAGILQFLQGINPHPLSQKEVLNLAVKVGADVPFFLNPQASIAEGVGEKIKIYKKKFNEFYSVLIYPGIEISTPWVFNFWDTVQKSLTERPSIAKNHCSSFSQEFFMGNDFEPIVFMEYPIISQIQARFLDLGAFVSSLSGTGSSIFGFFEDGKKAEHAVKIFKEFLRQKDVQIYGPFLMKQ